MNITRDILERGGTTIDFYYEQLNAVDYHFEKYENKRRAAVVNELSEEEEDYIDPAEYDTDYEDSEEA